MTLKVIIVAPPLRRMCAAGSAALLWTAVYIKLCQQARMRLCHLPRFWLVWQVPYMFVPQRHRRRD